MYPNSELNRFHQLFSQCKHKALMGIPRKLLPIAYLELLAALISITCFIPQCPGQLVRLNCDNSDAVAWLHKSRCSAGIGFRILAAVELYKRMFHVKISAHHIKGVANKSADFLSRGEVPLWLRKHGIKINVNLAKVADLLVDPLSAWTKFDLSWVQISFSWCCDFSL